MSLLIPEDHADEEPQSLERTRGGEGVEHHETMCRRKDGTLRDVSLTVSPLKDAAGRIIGASQIARDITERKCEETLRAAHVRLQAHADELGRFNQVAVGRELRMIELKTEINELCRRLGDPARYEQEHQPEARDRYQPEA